MTDRIDTVRAPQTPRGPTFANVCLMLLVGCCLCASLAMSIL